MTEAPSGIARVGVRRLGRESARRDDVIVEEPLDIQVKRAGVTESLAITIRTPGADLDLAAGFLWSEGFVTRPEHLVEVKVCADQNLTPRQRANVVVAALAPDAPVPPTERRRFTVSSACGVCGSSTLSDLRSRGVGNVRPLESIDLERLAGLPDRLRGKQKLFDRTGGLHAAGLFVDDEIVLVREDVGRHNAVDKVVGAALMSGRLPWPGAVLVVSGRAGYELVQKAVCAGFSALVSVSAPTSLAVETAAEFGLVLVGFARGDSAVLYTSP